MTSTTIGLKLNFKYNFNVSSSDNLRDQLVVIVLDPLVFRTTKPTYLDNYFMMWPLKKQFPKDETSQ
jgi:hypothetical protein